MDDERFDALIKRLGTTRLTRGRAVHGLIVGIATAATGVGLTALDANAKKKTKRKGTGKKQGSKGKKDKGRGRGSRNVSQRALTCSAPTSVTTDPDNPKLCDGGVRIEEPERGCKTITDPCGCTLEWCVTLGAKGEELSFGPVAGQPACTVARVVVKGGNEGATIYTFDPPALCASGLTTPTNQEISHFDVCGIACCVPKTCQDVGCTNGPISDGCAGEIDCPCNDHDLCTEDRCDTQAKQCVYTPVDCNDHDACTTDSCDPATGCIHTPVDCNSHDLCIVDTCDPKTGCVHTPVTCDDGDPCTEDRCDPATGQCVHRNICICTDDESPKGCPNPGDDPQYTCKRCASVSAGSVQVVCSGTTPTCVCNSKNCTVNGKKVARGTVLSTAGGGSGICDPVHCAA
jgi:hypothetical protein